MPYHALLIKHCPFIYVPKLSTISEGTRVQANKAVYADKNSIVFQHVCFQCQYVNEQTCYLALSNFFLDCQKLLALLFSAQRSSSYVIARRKSTTSEKYSKSMALKYGFSVLKLQISLAYKQNGTLTLYVRLPA